MILSSITNHGMRMTSMCKHYGISLKLIMCFPVSSFLELIPHIFQIEGVTCFLSEKLCQDLLEGFFGCQRQCGRTNENPTVCQFLKNTQSICVINSICVDEITGNCHGCKRKSYDLEYVDLNQPLKKRHRHYSG